MIDKFDMLDLDTIKPLYKTMARNNFCDQGA